MTDNRILKLAHILVNHSIKVKKGSTIKVSYGLEAKDLALEVYKLIIQKGAFPISNAIVPGFGWTYYRYASDAQLKKTPVISQFEAEHVDGSIYLGCEYNKTEFSKIDPKKIALRSKTVHPISETILKKNNWCGCEFPTHTLAQDAEMSLIEFEDFFFKATNVDWEKEAKRQDVLKKIMDKGKKVRIVSADSEITFSIAGRRAIKCFGKRNMPDGEVFIAPVENTVEGHIHYSYPAIFSGREITDVYLEFKKGKVVKSHASKNLDFLNAMLDTDSGSRYLGEFGIGTNYNLNTFIKQMLFDEKMGGTIHLALGMAYKKGGGKNESAIHWDMLKDLRQGGEIWIDDTLIQKNGKFTVKF